jgi:hypothetical protein
MVRTGDSERLEAWVQRCIDEGPAYAWPAEHRAMLEAAPPECKLRFQPLQIEELAETNGSKS